MILIRKKSKIKVVQDTINTDTEGRIISVKVQIEDLIVRLINLYAPNNDEPQFFQKLDSLIQDDGDKLIIGGDFNLVLDLGKDKVGGNNITHNRSQMELLQQMEKYSLIDIWRFQHKEEQKFTWEKYHPDIILERLDYLLVSEELIPSIPLTEIAPRFLSDHATPYLILKPTQITRGPGFWRLNTSLLSDENYVEQVIEIIREEKGKSYSTNSLKWETIKMHVRGFSIQYSSRKKKSRENILAALDKKLDRCKQDIIDQTFEIFTKQQTLEQIDKIEQERNKLIEYKLKGACIRSRREWLENGEKNSKMFFNLEKQNNRKKNRAQIRLDNGKITSNNNKILEEQKRIYSDLYKTRNIKINDEYLNNISLPQISKEERAEMDKEITEQEIKDALNMMDKDKVPGIDGFPSEFYKTFWEEIKGIMTYLIREVLVVGFAESARRGVISLIEKPERDLLKILEWRPLSLCNVDFKIAGKILANRLYKVLPKIIKNEQTGFMKERGAAENVLTMLSQIEYCTLNNIEALLVSFDFAKAFDHVEWNVLYKIMHRFNISSEFTKKIQALYTGIQSCTTNNGFTSEYFNITRGLRQGCTLSPPAFLLYVEVLGEKIRQNKNIQSILQGEDVPTSKHGQFADDLWAIIKADRNSYEHLIKEFDLFSRNTGLKINYDKTQVVRIGSLRHSNAKFYSEKPIQWSEGTKILGFKIKANLQNTIDENFNQCLFKIEKTLSAWQARSMTLIGRILLVNTLAISLTTHLMTCLPTPESFFKKAKEIIVKFIWKNKKPKIAYDKLIQKIQHGGLKLIDLKTKEIALKTKWIKKSLENPQSTWAIFASKILPMTVPEIWEANIQTKDVERIYHNKCNEQKSVWYHIWKQWSRLNYVESCEQTEEILGQMIWLNSHIKKENKTTLLPNKLYNKGIIYIRDVYEIASKTFLNYTDVSEKYNLQHSTLDYLAIVSMIPRKWKRKLKDEQIIIENVNNNALIETILSVKKCTRISYDRAMLQYCPTKDMAREAWNSELKTNLSTGEWERLRMQNYKMTLSVKLKFFQYRLLSKRLTTNVLRNKWDKNVSELCALCGEFKETTVHILWNCTQVEKFWTSAVRWLAHICNIKIQLNLETIILNNYTGQYKEFINTYILVGKQHIYATKCQHKTNLDLTNLLRNYMNYTQTKHTLQKKKEKNI